MGEDKGLAKVGDRPMLLHVVHALSSITADVVVAVGSGCGPGHQELLGPDVRVVEDRTSGRGPLEGLCNAFGAVRGTYVVVAPCDVPLLRTEVLELLVGRSSGRDGAVPVVRGYLEPLVAVYKREEALRRFSNELETGLGRVGKALEGMDICRVEEEDLRRADSQLLSFWNVNSKEDLEAVGEFIRKAAINP